MSFPDFFDFSMQYLFFLYENFKLYFVIWCYIVLFKKIFVLGMYLHTGSKFCT